VTGVQTCALPIYDTGVRLKCLFLQTGWEKNYNN
jgi:hypothetical protein